MTPTFTINDLEKAITRAFRPRVFITKMRHSFQQQTEAIIVEPLLRTDAFCTWISVPTHVLLVGCKDKSANRELREFGANYALSKVRKISVVQIGTIATAGLYQD
jgi:hypothetical protein